MVFTGSLVALITPFDRKGRLDRKTVEKLVEWHIAEGTDGIVCCATTGEGPCLSSSDKKALAEICIRTSAGRIPIIVSTGTNDTRASVRDTERAQKLGASGCLAVTPYYNKPTQRGLLLHYREIGKVGLPVIVYHNPPRAVIKLTFETIAELGQIPNIVALKDSNHDIEFARKIHKLIPIFAGDDDVTVDVIRAGGVGSIGVTTNLIPRGWKKMVQYALQGQWDKADQLLQRYTPLLKAIFSEVNPQGIKFATSWIGKCQPILRLPMLLPAETAQLAIQKEILRLALPQFVKQAIGYTQK
ncbi:MAG TPA: 4-hydroxy-tetrahydrodipicolinate synthase [Chlamydiales bacterium]|nr:4-hydroxy-tetrahydrodipicolinate synthase [Chlamydiales bacterium]